MLTDDRQLATLVTDRVPHARPRSLTFQEAFVGLDRTSAGLVRRAPNAQRVSNPNETAASLFTSTEYKGTGQNTHG